MARIEILRDDITHLRVDAIVNAANRSLLGGGGVDGAIHSAAGPGLLQACRELNGCETGEAKITPGFRLPSRYVIHTVGPVWNGGMYKERELLAACYKNALQLAIDHEIKTIAFPNISTGVYHFPQKEASQIAIETVMEFLVENQQIEKVIFCCFGWENFELYNDLWKTSYQKRLYPVGSRSTIETTATLAKAIWNEHYVSIIGQDQVDYMIEKFQSANVIAQQLESGSYEYWLVYFDGCAAGYLATNPLDDSLFLSKFYIGSQFRGKGLGRYALEKVKQRARDLSKTSITLTVNKNNLNSIKAYGQLGFRNEGALVTDIGGGYIMDDYQMRLLLE